MNGNLIPVDSRGVLVETNDVEEEDALNRSELKGTRLGVALGGLSHRRGGIRLVSRRQRGSVVALVARHCCSVFADGSWLLDEM